MKARIALLTVAVTLAISAPAFGFGTINLLGQNAEHERMTRASLACAATAPQAKCFQPTSILSLAGGTGTFGGVGAPDLDETFVPAAHCDEADFLNVAGYPRTRAQADTELLHCRQHLKTRFFQGITAAAGLLDAQGRIIPAEVDLSTTCTFTLGIPGRAKCNVYDGFGRALHGVQDFYSHSNWADSADATLPISVTNPPGLNRTTLPQLLNFPFNGTPGRPIDLSTGCFSFPEFLPGCGESPLPGSNPRIRHRDINKDTGTINPNTGAATAPTTTRGQVGTNFSKAVTGAIKETKQQWHDFQKQLLIKYGTIRGRLMICALTLDDPVKDCQPHHAQP